MKTFRIWLLVLLAVLLPVRGAVAAAMLCQAAGADPSIHAQVEVTAHGHHGMPESGAVEASTGHSQDSDHSHPVAAAHDHGSTSHECNLCASCCSLSGPPSASPSVAQPHPQAAVYPGLTAPAPSFFSDGQERPPRTT